MVGQRSGWACAVLPIVFQAEVRAPHVDDGRPARVSARLSARTAATPATSRRDGFASLMYRLRYLRAASSYRPSRFPPYR